MKISDRGAKLLMEREAKRLKAYKDSKGIWTIGVGHTGPEVKEGLVWTDKQVQDAFQKDVKWAEDAVNTVTAPLNQDQFDALVSFVFNVGATQFNNSTMKKKLNRLDFTGAANEFNKWVIPTEVTSRRYGEKYQFMQIEFVARKA